MQQQPKENTNEQKVDLLSLRVQIGADSSEMLIESIPFYFFNFTAFFGLVLLALFTYSEKNEANKIGGIIGVVILSIIAIYSVAAKRVIRCRIRKDTNRISYFRGGILGSKIDMLEFETSIEDLLGLIMRRYINWWWRIAGDNFQITIIIKGYGVVDLSGKDLSFSDCQSTTELIRNFVNPALPVKAED